MTMPLDKPDIRHEARELNEQAIQMKLEAMIAEGLSDPLRDPVEEADAFRDTMPEDEADELSLAKGEIAWLREAVRRLSIAVTELAA